MLFYDLNDTLAAYAFLRVAANEEVVVGAGRHLFGIPNVGAIGYVFVFEYYGTPSVEDLELVVRPASFVESDY